MNFNENMILTQKKFNNKTEVIDKIGELMLDNGLISSEYIEGMHLRDKEVSVYMGNYLAIPHAIFDYQKYVKTSGIVLIQIPEGVDFDNNEVKLAIGIAASGDDHMDLLSKLAILCSDKENVEKLVSLTDKKKIIEMIGA